ncbi:hypothetical protein K4F52_000860 [Lecanicillium sp. MT-2017a]|nr:hypothetical protein K4F52_000860 [Lecanicillium sp. MT-2017a]
MHPSQQQGLHGQQPPSSNPQHWRRSPSINTFSTQSSFQPPAAYRTSSSSDLRRSTSSRSVGTMSQPPTSYVALLRKQKATVWSERAQYEDPRTAAQQRAAKMRANREVVSGGAGRTGTGLVTTSKVAAKIRHHGKNPVVGYAPGETHVGVGGVPIRLSATEVEGDGSDDDDGPVMGGRGQHRRTGSTGRNSSGSGRRTATAGQQGQYRSSGGPPSQRQSAGSTPDRTGSMATQPIDESTQPADDSASGRAQSSGSGGSAAERRDDVGELGVAPKAAPNALLNAALTREKSVKTAEELRRRGSVDERTATLTSGRLYIANPD